MRRLPLLLLFLSVPVWAEPAAVKVDVLQGKLDHPWSLAFLPDNHGMLITLRGGQLRLWQAGKGLSDPISGVPKVWAHGQGGLLDVVLAPDFAQSRRVWLSYAEVDKEGKAGTAVGYGRLSEDFTRLEAFQTVFRSSRNSQPATTLVVGWCLTAKAICGLRWVRTTSARRRRIWRNCRANWYG